MPIVPLALAAFVGGVLAVCSPCILPVLPLVFGAAGGRPFVRWALPMLLGLVVAFALAVAAGAAGAAWLVRSADVGRWIALALLALTGAALFSPPLAALLARPAVRVGAGLERAASRHGAAGDALPIPFVLGVATGLIWAPCAGPILGLVVSLTVSGAAPASAVTMLVAFGAGTATALGAGLALAGRMLDAARRPSGADVWLRRGLGALTLAAVASIALGVDTRVLPRLGLVQTAGAEEVVLSRVAPNAKRDVSRALARRAAPVPTPDLGPLPDLAGGSAWLNAGGLALSDGATLPASALRGKVVVVNVWTFECYNCLNALPYVKRLAGRYRTGDVVVIGVHTPELPRERVPANVASAVRRLGVTYPVVLDPDYRIWRAFGNEYWPSVYIADKGGRIRFRHFGEGAYDEEDRVVAQLMAEPTR